MRWTIGKKVFLALLLTSFVVLALSAAINRWNLQRGFLGYVSEQEAAKLGALAELLAAHYANNENWDALKYDPETWRMLVAGTRETGSALPPPPRRERRRPPGAGREHPPRGAPPPGGAPHNDPLEIMRRLSFADASGDVIAGRELQEEAYRSTPVTHDGQIVGELFMASPRQLTEQLDVQFLDEQTRSMYLIAAIALALAALGAAVIARQLARPLRKLHAGADAMAAGRYDERIDVENNDELGDLAQDFNALAETLEKNRDSRRRWVADISHELRTPLSILRGELQAMEDGVRQMDKKGRRSLEVEVERLGKLVADLHDLTISDEGGLSFERKRVNVSELLIDVIENADHRLRDARIQVELDVDSEPVFVTGDRDRLQQLFTNLLENTLRYTDGPGRLRVRCRLESEAVTIVFADSAPDVPREALARLFERLYRVDASRSRATGGAGLGLSICKSIVDAHEGTIRARSSELGGIAITVHLPPAKATGG